MLAPGYSLRKGRGADRALLTQFMQRTYAELYPGGSFAHLAQTVEQCFSQDTPLWWVEAAEAAVAPTDQTTPQTYLMPVGCLWLGKAVDQISGERYTYIFLLYVSPAHRRQGIGAALMHFAEQWTQASGDRQVGLQVFEANQPARNLYDKLGFQPQSLLMVKSLPVAHPDR